MPVHALRKRLPNHEPTLEKTFLIPLQIPEKNDPAADHAFLIDSQESANHFVIDAIALPNHSTVAAKAALMTSHMLRKKFRKPSQLFHR